MRTVQSTARVGHGQQVLRRLEFGPPLGQTAESRDRHEGDPVGILDVRRGVTLAIYRWCAWLNADTNEVQGKVYVTDSWSRYVDHRVVRLHLGGCEKYFGLYVERAKIICVWTSIDGLLGCEFRSWRATHLVAGGCRALPNSAH